MSSTNSSSTNDPDAGLIAALEQWLAECNATLEKSFDQLVHLIGINRWHAEPDGGFRHYPHTPMYRFLELDDHIFTKSTAWPEVERLARSHENFIRHCDQMINLSDGQGGTFTLRELCQLLLPRLTMCNGRAAFGDPLDDVSSRVKDLMEVINADTADVLAIWPVSGVAAKQPIELDDRTVFRELTVNEKLFCLNVGIINPHPQSAIPANNGRWYGFCRRASGRKLFGQDAHIATEIFQAYTEHEQALEDFLAVVPLVNDRPAFHAGGIHSAPHLEMGGMLARGVTGRGGTSNGIRFSFVDKAAVISDANEDFIKMLWTFIRRAKKGFEARVANAARRLSYAESRAKPEDALVDLMIAAEALFQEDIQELSYKMPLRAALWAGGDNASKLLVFDSFRNAYRLRSKVVHGSSVSVDEVRAAVNSVKSVLRDGIRKAVVQLAESTEPPKWEELIFPAPSK